MPSHLLFIIIIVIIIIIIIVIIIIIIIIIIIVIIIILPQLSPLLKILYYQLRYRLLTQRCSIPSRKDGIRELPCSGNLETPLPLPHSLYGRTDVRSLDGLPKFLRNGCSARALSARRSSAIISTNSDYRLILLTLKRSLQTFKSIALILSVNVLMFLLMFSICQLKRVAPMEYD